MSDDLSQITDKNKIRKSANLLPVLFRTDKNSKFLSATIDQLIQPPQLKRVDGWVGGKITPTYNVDKDSYLTSNSKLRQDYQLEPALVVTNEILKIIKSTSYDDLINQLAFEGANVSRLDRLLKPEFYSYNPHIDWDKFVNFENYYWLPNGPDSVSIGNKQREIISTYNVNDTADGFYFVFTPDGLTPAPQITLYRGVTYKFNIDSKNPFWIKTSRVDGKEAPYRVTENNGVKQGQITLKIDHTTPKILYFVSENDKLNGGEFVIKNIEENSSIDVEKEIIGKREYTSANGIKFTNGLKVNFIGTVTPEKYQEKHFIIEGVGDKIKLIDFDSLETPEKFTSIFDERFDTESFDQYAFDQSNNFPEIPEYITINRASQDKNPWSRYNRWFHEDVIKLSAEANKIPLLFPVNNKAKRPIIEFEADLQLNNFGSYAKNNIQFIDTTTTDVFTEIEGQVGFYVDGVELGQGNRIIFTADADDFVNGKTFYVNFVKIDGKFKISLEEADDVTPMFGDSITITKGTEYKGTNWWYNGKTWILSQQKIVLNQAPRFEIFDNTGISYNDSSVYSSGYIGSKIFGYSIGTGKTDSVLGFPLKYKNVANQAYYLFENYFMTNSNTVVDNNVTRSLNISSGFIKQNISRDTCSFVNVWSEAEEYQTPVLQYNIITQSITELQITAIDNPGYQKLDVEVYLNEDKKVLGDEYTLFASGRNYSVIFKSNLVAGDKVLLKIKSTAIPSATGYYETSLGWTNNPLNGPISEFTLSELSDHVKTIVDRHPEFSGMYPGSSNLRDLRSPSSYGTRLISNKNPLAFAGYFIANDEYNLISATRLVGQHYQQFKLALIDQITKLSKTYTPSQALDIALYNVNVNKDVMFPYSMSDMIGYGTDAVTRNYTVTDKRNTVYSLLSNFNLNSVSERSVIIYHTNTSNITTQLLHGTDYYFDLYDSSVHIKIPLTKGDVIRVDDYTSTQGCYVPPTPTKLGLYPKYEPKIFVDDTYLESQTVIQGHDGSIMIAFGDNRDEVILEFERRIYNNLKVQYNPDLVNINKIFPGAFRTNDYTSKEVNSILAREFLKWDAFYGFNFSQNTTPNNVSDNPKVWNIKTGKDLVTKMPLPGGWRAVYKYFFDTDRPHTHPWEMLGFSEKPAWWETEYGPAPYTKGNTILWTDLEQGLIKDPLDQKINLLYSRPGLSEIIPVNDNGELLMPTEANIATGVNYQSILNNWEFGDMGPVETAWRRSSLWPFAVQILSALTNPASYSSLLFDTSRTKKNLAGQYTYGDTVNFHSFDILKFYQDTVNGTSFLASGYSVFLIEAGKQKNKNYLDKLKLETKFITSKLTHKIGGFVNKDKFKITIDSVNPSSANPGVTLTDGDYSIFLDKSSPVRSIGLSGIIVQKTDAGYTIKGYDNQNPYFTCLMPVFTATDPAITIGGKSSPFVDWSASAANPMTGYDTVSVSTNDGYRFYKQGQIVRYEDKFYRVKVSHNSGSTFDTTKFQPLTELPKVGGVTIKIPKRFETVTTLISYGTQYSDILDVYQVLIGYGHYLESQGLIFDSYNKDINEIIDWMYSAKELMFWSTQKWAVGSVITLSPFADLVKFNNSSAVVDNLTNVFYEYSVLKADGSLLSSKNISTYREENDFKLTPLNTTDGIYFVRLNLVQKEHTLVLNNYTFFNDVIYDTETGYRQRRIKLTGFVTDNWNGDLFSPGFIYDEADISSWTQYTDYSIGDVVIYAGNYYVANLKIVGKETFNFNEWAILGKKPVAELLPNFDYKISQFDDFYSLDIDNFDKSQQSLAQHLVGYTPRPYLDNIFSNATSQYKFYQGFIKEKGTKNSIDKLSKASIVSQGSYIDFYEDWAFRIGEYGAFSTDQTLEINLNESKFKENPQIIKFIQTTPKVPKEFLFYVESKDLLIKPDDYDNSPFAVTSKYTESASTLPTAGYVRIDDITATAYNKNSLLDIANNRSLKDGDTIWLGFENNGDWGVYRYTQLSAKVIDISIYIPGTSLLVTTDTFHNLSSGDIISISQFDATIDGVFTVEAVPELNQVVVRSLVTSLSTPFYPSVGLLFKFVSSRFAEFDDLDTLPTFDKFKGQEKIWVDDNGTGKWTVYQKNNNFNSSIYNSPADYGASTNQQYSYSIAGNYSGNKLIVAAPNYVSAASSSYGRLYAYNKLGTGTNGLVYAGGININPSSISTFFTGTNAPVFGQSIKFDNESDWTIVGAPKASYVKYGTTSSLNPTLVISTGTASTKVEEGLVEFVKFYFNNPATQAERVVITNQYPQSYANFGHDVAIAGTTSTAKTIFISAPGQNNNTGVVYYQTFDLSGKVLVPLTTMTHVTVVSPALNAGDRYGHSIAVNRGTLKRVAISAIGNGGHVRYTVVDATPVKRGIISHTGYTTVGENFGEKVLLDSDGEHLFVSAPGAQSTNGKIGKIFVFKYNSVNQEYEYLQTIVNTNTDNAYNFGTDMTLSPDGATLIVSTLGSTHKPYVTFDTYSKHQAGVNNYVLDPNSKPKEFATTFDSGTSNFYSVMNNSGAVFSFVKKQNKFIFAEELFDQRISSEQLYGTTLFATDKYVMVGAPGHDYSSKQTGALYIYESKSGVLDSWAVLREENKLVNIDTIKSVKTINNEIDAVIDYLEIIDPIKGKISGLADQELRYKSLFDPAVYSIGLPGVSTDTSSNWLDEHVGELWWDLGSVKYTWYEQGELEFRKNNWNSMFPGSMIDVYEWVGTPYLPSQWSAIADTNDGLSQGISGQPKFPDNSVISVKQVWDAVSNSFSNFYYYWVKNKTTIPAGTQRKISAYNVSTLIANPKSQGVKFASIISNDAIMLTNMQNNVIGTKINLSIDLDTIDNINNKHTEWLLLQEGNKSSLPPKKLVDKMLASLVKKDSADNPVPDTTLSSRNRYGIGVRPRQTMFVNIPSALRVLVEYSNSVLEKHNIVDYVNLSKFLDKDTVPNPVLGQYDYVVEDLLERDFSVVTRSLKRAILTSEVRNGKITNVVIVNAGYGYHSNYLKSAISNSTSDNYVGPTIKIDGTGSGAVIETEINAVGQIVKVNIINPGSGYITPPTLTVRPFSVIVTTDTTVNNKWSKYEWNYTSKEYNRISSQSYDTTSYWKYIDWIDPTYNNAQDILATINEPYQLFALIDVPEGNYVKIRNAGDGRYIVIRKIASSQATGTYNSTYDLVYQEKGTIQLLDLLWNSSESIYGFDQDVGFDQTLFDQTPVKEIENIFMGLFEDVFVKELKVYYNLLFFKMIKYALSEQKSLDWVFKTSFIDVVNYAGALDQRPVYKLNNESYYQTYIEETKPYHTKIRNFSANYTATDITKSITTDFDLPSVYDTTNKQFTPITFGRPELTVYPWKSWAENYGYFVESIQVYNGGSGYDTPPVVEIVPQVGDTGSGAKAVAYIALGKVTQIIVTEPGSGYTATPIINLIGGGSSTLTPAKVSLVMANNKVRSNKIKMKFDRVAGYNEVASKTATDKFIASGSANEFILTWAPNPDKNFITVKLNGIRVLSGDYSIETYTEKFRDYTKKYGKLVFSENVAKRTEITIEYRKDVSLYSAIDRIRDYYQPTSGMPGNTATLLMNGLEYPGVTIDTLPFGLSSGFDTLPFGANNWDDYIPEERSYQIKGPRVTAKLNSTNNNATTNTFYFNLADYPDVKTVKVGSTTTALTTNTIYTVTSSTYKGGTVSQWAIAISTNTSANTTGTIVFLNPKPYTYQLDFVPEVNESINVYVKTLNTVTNKFTTIRIDGTGQDAVMSTFVGDGYRSTVTINKVYDSTATIVFRTQSSDGSSLIVDPDLDTYISGGGYYTNFGGDLVLTKSNDYEDINLDGDSFVSATNSYGPEENLPGRVSDTLGMNIFTYPESGTGLVVNKKHFREPGVFRYDIGCQPPNVDSVEVILDGVKLNRGYDYTIDFATSEIVLLTTNSGGAYITVRGPYFSSTEVPPRKENINNPIASTAGDDTFTGPYSLGFEWNMFGTIYDQVYVGTNGYLTFGGGDSAYSPLTLGILNNPAIYVEYCDLWQNYGSSLQLLSTGETPGLFLSNGTIGAFTYWRLRFQGTHYNRRNDTPTVPAYQFEVTLYSNGTDQYIEMIYENTWRSTNFNGDLGFIAGVATGYTGTVPGSGVSIDYTYISDNSSHVFYSTANGGDWQYAGRGSFDAFANNSTVDPNVVSYDDSYVITVTDEALGNGATFANTIDTDWINFRQHYPNRRFALLQPQQPGGSTADLLIPPTFNNSFKAVGPLVVSRDNGVASSATDWFSLLSLQDLLPGTVVGIAIDVSGSMNTSTVQASYDLFLQKAASAGLSIVREFWNSERWPYVWDRTLPVSNLSPLSESKTQFLSITTMDVGGKNLIDKQQIIVSSITGRNNFEIAVSKTSVKSSYVTVNGVKSSTYTIVGSKNGTSGRAIIRFTNNLNYNDVVQVWAFAGDYKSFSEVFDQIIIANSGLNTFALSQSPGVIGPLHSQIIVERNGTRLSPPDTVYYIAEKDQLTFSFDQHYDYAQGLPDMAHLEIYVNGVRRPFGPQVSLIQEENLVEFAANTISAGDAIAITILQDHDYIVQGQSLIFTDRIDTSVASRLRVTTFTNHDNSLIRRERFPGNNSGVYKLTRPSLSTNYVWVELNGKPLTRDLDYRLAEDKKTVYIRSSIPVYNYDLVVIMSVIDKTNEKLIGYRMFRDNLGRTHYKRLSNNNSTQLAADLGVSDTEITVEDSSVLSPPNTSKSRPGIILINGERIEFFKLEGNKLSGLRRGTLGTGVKILHKESSIVIDQGAGQTIIVNETSKTWTTATAYWATGADNIRYGTSTWDLSALTPLTFSTSTSTQYQIDVYVQGRQ